MICHHFRRRTKVYWRHLMTRNAGKTRFYVVILSFLFLTLYCLGFTDYLFEKDFTEFQWPPFVNVHEQVVRQLLNEKSEYMYVNNWMDYDVYLEPSCLSNRLTRKKSLLIVVKTAPNRLQNRDGIRATWGKAFQYGNWRIRTVFVMGKMPFSEFKVYGNVLQAEQKQCDDLLVGDFYDGYRNNTLKFMHSIKYANSYCDSGTVPYVLLVDDDYFVSIPNLCSELEKHSPNERLYMGWRFDSSPFRLSFAKHKISLDSYPFNKYPPYISAGAVLLTSQTIREFFLAIQYVQLFPFDDVFAGIIAYQLGISPQHSENFPFWGVDDASQSFARLIAVHGYSSQGLVNVYAKMNPN
uniref:Hexosyltransferase n=1 Tax=Panagrolaimus sp. JU765 TaxID=591449 RepID=A0AC34RFM7_9BILA